MRDGGVLVAPQRVGGAAQEQGGQQLRVDAALLAHHAHHHLNRRARHVTSRRPRARRARHLVKLDGRRAAAVGGGHHDVAASREGDVGQRHAPPQATQTLAGRQQGAAGFEQRHGDQTAHRHRQPALHRLAAKQRQRWRELDPGELLAKVCRTRLRTNSPRFIGGGGGVGVGDDGGGDDGGRQIPSPRAEPV